MAIYNDSNIRINLDELVECRAGVLKEELTKDEKVIIARELMDTLTWDTLFFMVDTAILNYVGKPRVIYGDTANEAWLLEIERNKKCFKLVELKGNSWTIQVPIRVKG
tara:strand:+ start:387 stop:710 length:324 start_codon:yes stop_codon:yes gene_type:complete